MTAKAIKASVKKNIQYPNKFPRIPRFITERKYRSLPFDAVFLVSFFCGILLMSLGLSITKLRTDMTRWEKLEKTRAKVGVELSYWEKIIATHNGYRDAYMTASILSYRLGKRGEAAKFLSLVLVIDPNFKLGRQLQEKISTE